MSISLSFEIEVSDLEEEVSSASQESFEIILSDVEDESDIEISEEYRDCSDSMGRGQTATKAAPTQADGARATRSVAKAIETFEAGPSRSTRASKQTNAHTHRSPLALAAPIKPAAKPAGKKRGTPAAATIATPAVKRRRQQQQQQQEQQEVPEPAALPMAVDAPACAPAQQPSQLALANSILQSPSPPRRKVTKSKATAAIPAPAGSDPGSAVEVVDPAAQVELLDIGGASTAPDAPAASTPPQPAVPSPRRYSPRRQSNITATDTTVAASQTEVDGGGPWWDPLDASKVRQAKAAFHCSSHPVDGAPLCRERQVALVEDWLKERLTTTKGGSMYVSGPPGTGKSLTIAALIRRCTRYASQDGEAPPRLVAVNCMRLTDPRQVVLRILTGCRAAKAQRHETRDVDTDGDGDGDGVLITAGEDCDVPLSALAGSDPLELLKKEVLKPAVGALNDAAGVDAAVKQQQRHRRSGSMDATAKAKKAKTDKGAAANPGTVVVMLDELDGLLGSGRMGDDLLGDLFALAHHERSRLVLIGIANSIDLVQQLMRPGGALHRRSIQPRHVIFPSYLRMEVSRLLNQRLQMLPDRVIDNNAVEFCARKIANGNGDMRRALEACNQAIDIVVADAQAENPSSPGASPSRKSPSKKHGAVAVASSQSMCVGMRHMAAALNRVTGGIGASNENVAAIRALPVPQQLMLCVLSDASSIKRSDSHKQGQAARFMSVKGSGASKAAGGQGDATLGELAETHSSLCRRLGVQGFAVSELCTVADVLQDLGLLVLGGGGKGLSSSKVDRRQRRVTLTVPLDDVTMALANVPVLKDVVGQGAVGRALKQRC